MHIDFCFQNSLSIYYVKDRLLGSKNRNRGPVRRQFQIWILMAVVVCMEYILKSDQQYWLMEWICGLKEST